MRRTRSLRKMKLPLRRPSTSSSPSGYAAVISWPSSRTRRAIVSSSKTIRLSSRPPVCLRLAVLGNIHPYRPGSGPREIVSTPADARHPQNGFAAGDDRIAGPVAPRHSRFHQHPPQRPSPDAAERNQPVARTGRPHFPVRSRDPRRPVRARQPGRRRIGSPRHAKLAEHRTAPLPGGDDFHGGGDRAGHPQAIERYLRHPPARQGQPPPGWAARQLDQLTPAPHPQDQAGTPRRGPQQHGRQDVIIASQPPPGNFDAVRLDAQSEIGQMVEDAVPGVPLARRRPPRPPAPRRAAPPGAPRPLGGGGHPPPPPPPARGAGAGIGGTGGPGEPAPAAGPPAPPLRNRHHRPPPPAAPTRGDPGKTRR